MNTTNSYIGANLLDTMIKSLPKVVLLSGTSFFLTEPVVAYFQGISVNRKFYVGNSLALGNMHTSCSGVFSPCVCIIQLEIIMKIRRFRRIWQTLRHVSLCMFGESVDVLNEKIIFLHILVFVMAHGCVGI